MNVTTKRIPINNNEKNRKLFCTFCIISIILLVTFVIICPYICKFMIDPFFWAFISMFALIGSSITLCCKYMKKYPFLNMVFVAMFAVGRFILVLPSLPQPRFDIYHINWIVGGFIFMVGLIFLIPILQINPFPSSRDRIILNTTGFYGITRNPIYLGEILWTLGWSVIFGSIIGAILVPLWWAGLLLNIVLEEEELERNIGQSYMKYKERVEGRIIPGLPI